jgi:hypothetical protein
MRAAYNYADIFGFFGKVFNIEAGLMQMRQTLAVVDSMEEETVERCGRRCNAQGADGMLSYPFRRSIRMCTRSVQRCLDFFKENPLETSSLLDSFNFESLMDLNCERFFVHMRVPRNPVPDQPAYLIRRADVTHHDRQSYLGLISDFTDPASYYPPSTAQTSHGEFLRPKDAPPRLTTQENAEKKYAHDFSGDFGKGVSQNKVRFRSLENPGHKPYSMSWTAQPTQEASAPPALPSLRDLVNSRSAGLQRHVVIFPKGVFVALYHGSDVWIGEMLEDAIDDPNDAIIIKYLEIDESAETMAADSEYPFIYIYGVEDRKNRIDVILDEVKIIRLGDGRFAVEQAEYDRLSGLIEEEEETRAHTARERRTRQNSGSTLDPTSFPPKKQSTPNPRSTQDRPRRSNASYFMPK